MTGGQAASPWSAAVTSPPNPAGSSPNSAAAYSAAYLYDRAEQGPWAEAWRARPEDGEYGERMVSLGFRAVAYAPIRDGGGLIGLLGIGTRDEAYAPHLIAHLPVVGEFAATASALLSVQLERERRDGLARARIAGVLDDGAFGPVFQPIVALDTGTVVGFEALTRFADGTPPDQVIGDAHVVGLGPELELACLVAALRASAALSSGCWLSLNLSPEALLHPSNLAELLARRHSGVVIEITEHSEILDYPAVRRRLAELGPTVSLAVDDAGAGFASLRHVVELQPQYLKLDVAMTRNVDRDAARQAMIAGLAHFAARVGCDVIAEGIERPGELAMLRMLGVTYGQGFLLGRPAPVQAAACGVMSVRRTRVRPLRDAPAPVG